MHWRNEKGIQNSGWNTSQEEIKLHDPITLSVNLVDSLKVLFLIKVQVEVFWVVTLHSAVV
jgi:hypothetical protein